MLAIIIFWLCVIAVFHSYLVFPLIIGAIAKGKTINQQVYTRNEELPGITILMAVYNEEQVIAGKIESIIASNYPVNKLEFLIGSDASTDNTNEIIKNYIKEHPWISLTEFPGRTGKPGIINSLYDHASNDLLVITDANVIFDPDTLYELAKHFKNDQIGLVDTNMVNRNLKRDGISMQEKTYITREVLIKQHESIAFGTMMGPFGGCYAIRKKCFRKVPPNFLVDDFYISMKVLEQGKMVINELSARVYEDVSNDMGEEFRRKVRIATGNFQNLSEFGKMLIPPFSGRAFSFLSHKVLRWLGPFFIVFAYLTNLYLVHDNEFYTLTFIAQNCLIALPIIDLIVSKIGLHVLPLRYITHFYSMNLALLIGFIKFMKGVRSNVWEPTARNV